MNVTSLSGVGAVRVGSEEALSQVKSADSAGATGLQEGDVVRLSAGSSVSRSYFTSDDQYSAYQSVVAQARTDPGTFAGVHSGLDADRVRLLIG